MSLTPVINSMQTDFHRCAHGAVRTTPSGSSSTKLLCAGCIRLARLAGVASMSDVRFSEFRYEEAPDEDAPLPYDSLLCLSDSSSQCPHNIVTTWQFTTCAKARGGKVSSCN